MIVHMAHFDVCEVYVALHIWFVVLKLFEVLLGSVALAAEGSVEVGSSDHFYLAFLFAGSESEVGINPTYFTNSTKSVDIFTQRNELLYVGPTLFFVGSVQGRQDYDFVIVCCGFAEWDQILEKLALIYPYDIKFFPL